MPAKFKILILFFAIFLASCASWGTATTVPDIYLTQSDITMELKKEAFAVTAMAVSNDGKYLVTGDNGGSTGGNGTPWLRLWDLTEMKQLLNMRDLSGTVNGIDISPDGRYAITGGAAYPDHSDNPQYPLSIFDLSTGKLFKTFDSSQAGHQVVSTSFSRDGRYFLITTLDDKTQMTSIRIFDAKTWSLVKTLPYPKEPGYVQFTLATFSPDGKYILSGGAASVVRLWDVETGREIKTFTGHKQSHWGGMISLAFSSDGRYALTGSFYDEFVRLWDIEKGLEARRFFSTRDTDPWYKANVFGVAVSPDWKSALIFSRDSKLYDIGSGRLVANFRHFWKGLKTMTGGQRASWPISAMYHPNGQYIFMTMTDAAVRIYDAKTGDEVAVLIGFVDGEWIVITSEGYYNSSEKGAQYLSVKVGETSYSVDSFYDVFYRPDIVAAKLRGEDIKDLITITMKDAIKSPPPVVEISPIAASPASPKAKVCYNVKSIGGGIGEVRLFHNGKLIESDGYYKDIAKTTSDKTQLIAMTSKAIYEDMRSVKIKEKGIETGTTTTKSKGEVFNDCKEIDAISGENEISITAFNKDNTVQSYMQTAKFTSTVKQEEPHLYILSIGIDQYKDNTSNLKYAVKDSKDIEERIMRQAATLYKPQNIHYELLADSNAIKTNITTKINELSKTIKPTDTFILFVAGHGVLLQNLYYVLTSDYDGKVSEQSMISSNEIVEMSKKIKSLSQLFIFDTCHAGGVDYIVSGLYDARMSVLAKKMGLHIYASASSKEAAMDGYQGNGLFTYTLLDGLNNNRNADKNKDNAVSLTELGEYSKQTTTEISKKIGHQQTPLIINFGKDNPVYNLR
ncbi:MAG: wd40 repeat subgroup [Nitrospirae bacterium]|nr:MAG: wd40 repeat subgroup [Nitrospirota bacterium]